MKNNKRYAQSMIEYALLVAIVVGALLSMYNYLSRALQGRLRATSDSLPGQLTPGGSKGIEVAGTIGGHSTVSLHKSQFSYEGGQYEGSVFVNKVNTTESTDLKIHGKMANSCTDKDIADGKCNAEN